jgi:hypothetical protein
VNGQFHMQELGAAVETGTWGGYAAQLLGAGSVGFLLRELVKRWFARKDRQDDIAAGLRGEMLRRIEMLERQYTTLEKRERESYSKAIRLEAENRHLRRRWHELMNWIQSEPSLPQPPRWLFESVDGPTADERPRPKEQP